MNPVTPRIPATSLSPAERKMYDQLPKPTRGPYKRWTPYDEQYLWQHRKRSPVRLAAHFGVSICAIRRKLTHLHTRKAA